MRGYRTMEELVTAAEGLGARISDCVIAVEAERAACAAEELLSRMDERLSVMEAAAREGLRPDVRSTSGLTGGGAYLVSRRVGATGGICGSVFGGAISKAIAVAEHNAAMGRIVAAPTAGSCGILPAAVLTVLETAQADRDSCVRSLFSASAVGEVIARNACLAGAQGGCQAECGSAAAMAAAAVTEVFGGSPRQVAAAVSIALQNVLGLVCDPVAGLVEVPCVMRNASGVANALTASEVALAGVDPVIPADEAIAAMKEVGDMMPACLRETAQGGLAVTPTGRRLHEELFGN